jgi:hypothetical protein
MFIEALPDLPFGDWVRTCIAVPFEPAAAPDASGALRAILSFAKTVPGLGVSVRIGYEPGQPLRRVLVLLAPAASEGELRRFAARFTRLELVAGQAAKLPCSQDHLDEILGLFPRWQCRAVAAAEGNGEPWFLPDFTLLPGLEELLWTAGSLAAPFSFQANFWPSAPTVESLRGCSYNLLKVEGLVGVPESLVALQRRVVSKVRAAGYVAEEFAGVSSPEAARAVSRQISAQFDRTHGPLKFPRIDFPFRDLGDEDAIDSGFHTAATAGSAPPQSWVEACSFERIVESAVWKPNRWIELAIPEAARPAAEPEPPTALPEIDDPAGRAFAFISYSRADHARVSALLRILDQQGIPYWYDQHIPGAADWHEMLEERISRCGFFMLMLSPAAAGSRYVRREVAFADSLNKPILTVRLEPTELVHGLGFTVGAYQMIEGQPDRFPAALAAAVKFLRSEMLRPA